jgi:E3 SUMO-protein ligase RanBP2
LYLHEDSWSDSPARAKYWCELAETENVRDDNVFNLRLKMANKDKKSDGKPVEEMILKEIAARPHDINMRIRMVKHLLDEKRLNEAFKYCFDLEMKFIETFQSSNEWYNTISDVLKQTTSSNDTWNSWCMILTTMDKQIYLNLKKDLSLQAIKQNYIKEVTNLLFEFDQVLKKAADALLKLAPVKEMAEEVINHFRGQLALNLAAILFQKQKVTNNDQWRETTKKCLPLLLFAFQTSIVNTDAFWLKNTTDVIRNLMHHLKKEGAFRCVQAARTILACKAKKDDDLTHGQNYKCWFSIDDIFNQIREICTDTNWRKNLYRLLFANTDQQSKSSSSYFVQNSFFQEPTYETISFNDIESYEDMAQYLYPSSLEHHVYLGLGRKDLQSYKTRTFDGLNLSTSNLINCSPETINRLDIDSFLYCAIIQAKRRLEAEKDSYESFNNKPNEKPLILPAANVVEGLCTEEQNEWWLAAYKIYKNISGDNIAQLKATLQFGIEAVRGIDTPKVDSIILLKLGDVLQKRTVACGNNLEHRHVEIRVPYIYKFALKMLRNRESDNMRRIFKFSTNNFDMEGEMSQLIGTAIGHLSTIYFQREEFREFIDDFSGIQNPWVHFYRAEAYKKLDESSKTPKKTKKIYIEKARENLMETLALLEGNANIDKNNPLRVRVEKDLKRLQYDLSTSINDDYDFNLSQNGITPEDDIFHNASSSSFRGRREVSFAQMPNYNEKFNEVENLIRKLSDLVISVKDDVLCVRNDITGLKDDILTIRGDITDLSVNKDASTTKTLNDIYKSIEDLTWNVTYMMNILPNQAGNFQIPPPMMRYPTNQMPPAAAQYNQTFNTAYPIYPNVHSRSSLPGQIPAHLQFSNTDMNSYNYMADLSVIPSPSQQQPQSQQQINTLQAQVAKLNGQKSSPVPIPEHLQFNSNSVMNTYNYMADLHTVPSPSQQPSQLQQQPGTPQAQTAMLNAQKSSLLEALNTPSVLNTWTNTYPSTQPAQMNINSTAAPVSVPPVLPAQTMIVNKPVEKAPPVNVVITSSDPLPTQNSFVSQPTLSVTIPPQHIKHAPSAVQQNLSSTSFNTSAPLYENISPSKAVDTSEYLEEPADYDPRPDFQPIIPLPDEVEVKTGEENENILFEKRAKLFRMDDKEWKERGIGNIKILQNKDTNKCRIVMRREQTHKLCANHMLIADMELKNASKENNFMWAANDYSDGEMKPEKFLVRFKYSEDANKFKETFNQSKKYNLASVVAFNKEREAQKKKEKVNFIISC